MGSKGCVWEVSLRVVRGLDSWRAELGRAEGAGTRPVLTWSSCGLSRSAQRRVEARRSFPVPCGLVGVDGDAGIDLVRALGRRSSSQRSS